MPSSIADRRVSGAFVRLLDSVVAAGMVVFIASSAGASPLKSCTGLLAQAPILTHPGLSAALDRVAGPWPVSMYAPMLTHPGLFAALDRVAIP